MVRAEFVPSGSKHNVVVLARIVCFSEARELKLSVVKNVLQRSCRSRIVEHRVFAVEYVVIIHTGAT
jgi:hypothetical protein